MKLLNRTLQTALLIVLCAPQFSFAQSSCGSLFSPFVQKAPAFEIKRSLLMLQMISHASVKHYRDFEGRKTITVLYDKNRAAVVVKNNRIVKIEREDGAVLKTYPFTKDQTQALTENLQKLSQHTLVAVVDPYTHQSNLRETNHYGLYDIAKRSITPREGFREPSPVAKAESIRSVNEKSKQYTKAKKAAHHVAFAAGLVGLYNLPEAQIGVPILISAYGLGVHSSLTRIKNIWKTQYQEQGTLARDLAEKALAESNSVVLIVPDFVRPYLEVHLKQNFEPLN